MIDIVIVGAGGFGRELLPFLDLCFSPQTHRLKGFLAQNASELDNYDVAAPVLGDPEQYTPEPQDRFLLAIGNMKVRKRVVEALTAKGGEFLTLVHPTAVVAPTAIIGVGAVIYPLTVVSNCAHVGDYAHLSTYASLGHDARTGKYCLLAPYATLNGFCILEDEVYLSTHSTVVPGRRVGQASVVSANSAVMRDVPPHSFVFGVPGKVMPRLGA
ncbi:MAG: acetyltransferase [Planctomycetales bacterium]|nr:acetyltransferase [Planctomycetales bacterium]